MHEHGGGPALRERGQERGRERPEHRAGDAQRRAVCDAGRGEPGAEHGKRHREDPQQHDGLGRVARPERAEHCDHRREGVGRSDLAEPERAQPVAGIRPEPTHGRPQRSQATAAERRPHQQRGEHGHRHHQCAQHCPRTAAREEAQLAATHVGVVCVLIRTQGLPQLVTGHAQRREQAPRRRSSAPDAGACLCQRTQSHDRDRRGPPLREDPARRLADQLHDRAPQRDRHEREPLQRDRPRRGIGQTPVQLCAATHVRVVRGARGGQAGQPRDAVAVDGDARGRNDDHTPSGQAQAHPEVESLVGSGQRGVDALNAHPRVGAHEHRADVGAQHVLGRIVLALVELVVGEADGAAEPRHRRTQRHDAGAVIPPHELGGDHPHRRRELQRVGEVGQRIRLWRRVLGEQPDGIAMDVTAAQRQRVGETRPPRGGDHRGGRG